MTITSKLYLWKSQYLDSAVFGVDILQCILSNLKQSGFSMLFQM